MNYKGVIIEESLDDRSVLDNVKTVKTRVEKVTPKHKTPWLTRWTLHTVEIKEANGDAVADLLSKSIETDHASSWYADFRNDKYHYIIFRGKVFKVGDGDSYQQARAYGLSLGIPKYQMDFESFKRNLVEI